MPASWLILSHWPKQVTWLPSGLVWLRAAPGLRYCSYLPLFLLTCLRWIHWGRNSFSANPVFPADLLNSCVWQKPPLLLIYPLLFSQSCGCCLVTKSYLTVLQSHVCSLAGSVIFGLHVCTYMHMHKLTSVFWFCLLRGPKAIISLETRRTPSPQILVSKCHSPLGGIRTWRNGWF